jgi:hypothetical protein
MSPIPRPRQNELAIHPNMAYIPPSSSFGVLVVSHTSGPPSGRFQITWIGPNAAHA